MPNIAYDTFLVEMGLPIVLNLNIAIAMGLFICVLIPSIMYPTTIVTTLIIFILMYYVEKLIFKSVNDSATLQSSAASQLILELVGSVAGAEIIRAYKKEDMFLKR